MKGEDIVGVIKNSATLAGSLFTLHVCQVRIDLPTLSDKDKQVSPEHTCAESSPPHPSSANTHTHTP